MQLSKVTFEKHNPDLSKLFTVIKKTFPQDCKVSHVGSSALQIPGKNILDVLVETKNPHKLKSHLLKKNWSHIKPKKNRKTLLLIKKVTFKKKKTTVHIHLATPNSVDAKKIKFFVSYLSTHPKEKREYIQLKKEAVRLGKTNNADYNAHKHEFIQSILKKMK